MKKNHKIKKVGHPLIILSGQGQIQILVSLRGVKCLGKLLASSPARSSSASPLRSPPPAAAAGQWAMGAWKWRIESKLGLRDVKFSGRLNFSWSTNLPY